MARRNTIEILITAKDKASPVLKGIGGNVQTLGKIALGGLGVLAGAAAAGGVALLKFAVDAAPLEGVTAAFEGITESSGESADAMLAALQRGSAGMITQRDLMESYNTAAQLVGTTFANQLPGAMEYLGKVAGATGEDMSYMMDSLVKGVGRLSPMILDNLGIQVNLTEANEAFADQLGITVAEMSKAQQQEALMAQVLEKLAENTAAMPDVTGTAAQGIAALKASFIDMKDKVGLVVLPILEKFLGWASEAAQKYLPIVMGALEKFIGVIENLIKYFEIVVGEGDYLNDFLTRLPEPIRGVVEWLGKFVASIEPLINYFKIIAEDGDYLNDFLTHLPKPIQKIVQRIGEFVATAKPMVDGIVKWIKEFVSWKDVLIGLGVAIAAVVLPALWGIVAAAAPIIAAGALLIGIIALVRNAWENNLGGIQEKVQVVFGFIGEQVAKVRAWFQENIPLIMETLASFREGGGQLADFWQSHIVPILDNVWNIIKIIIDTAIDYILGIITLAMQVITGDWEGAWKTVQEMFSLVWGAVGKILTEAIEGIANFLGTTTGEIVKTWKNYWGEVRQTIRMIWKSIVVSVTEWLLSLQDSIQEIVDSIVSWWEDSWESVKDTAEDIWDKIYIAVSTKVKEIYTSVTEKIAQVKKWWAETWNRIYSKLAEIWEIIVSAVVTKVGEVYEVITSKVGEVSTKWGETWDSIKEKLAEIWLGIVTAVTEKMLEVYAAIEGPIEEIKQWIIDQVTRFYQIGSDLIQGMIDGVGAMAGALADKISSMIEEIIQWVLRKLGIDSPSQVFFEIGESIGQGLIEGIESMIAGVGGTMTDLVSALLSAASKLGGIGGFFAGLLEKGELADVRKALKRINAELEKGPPVMPTVGPGTSKAWQEYFKKKRLWELYQRQRHELLAKEIKLQAKIAELEKKRQQLAFLQQQLRLLDLIQEYGLNAEEILQGMTLGLDADIEGIVEAMTRAMQAIIEQAEKELDISSPSKVFYDFGRMMMAGLARGIEGGAVQPIASVGGVLAGMSRNVAYTTSNTFAMTVNTQAPVSTVIQDFEIMRAMVQ